MLASDPYGYRTPIAAGPRVTCFYSGRLALRAKGPHVGLSIGPTPLESTRETGPFAPCSEIKA